MDWIGRRGILLMYLPWLVVYFEKVHSWNPRRHRAKFLRIDADEIDPAVTVDAVDVAAAML
jgi:hypothetical protein